MNLLNLMTETMEKKKNSNIKCHQEFHYVMYVPQRTTEEKLMTADVFHHFQKGINNYIHENTTISIKLKTNKKTWDRLRQNAQLKIQTEKFFYKLKFVLKFQREKAFLCRVFAGISTCAKIPRICNQLTFSS